MQGAAAHFKNRSSNSNNKTGAAKQVGFLIILVTIITIVIMIVMYNNAFQLMMSWVRAG